jgi:putative Mn2+ efflux pump MntP
MLIVKLVLEAMLITLACSMDCLVTGFSYGVNKIKIPVPSMLIINIVASLVLGLSLVLGAWISRYIPLNVTLIISSATLVMIGAYKIFFGIKNHESADKDKNKILSPVEAIVLALALSLDGLGIGLGAGLVFVGMTVVAMVVGFSLVINFAFLALGQKLGNITVKRIKINLSWLAGMLLVLLAVLKIVA